MISETFQVTTQGTFPPRINIRELVDSNLPMMPGSVTRIGGLLSDYNAPLRKLTEAISYDPVLTARILRLANSPIFSMQKSITTLQHAIEVVGLKSIYEILIIGLAADSFAKEIKSSNHGRKVWEHSVAVALLARDLSHILGLRGTEEAFICGLLHDIGKILLLRKKFDEFSGVLETNSESEMLLSEHNIFGYTHAQIGSLVANRWELPEAVCRTILYHHDPSQSEQFLVMAHLVSAADTIANAKGCGLRVSGEINILETESAIMLHLTEEQIEKAWEKASENISEITRTFG